MEDNDHASSSPEIISPDPRPIVLKILEVMEKAKIKDHCFRDRSLIWSKAMTVPFKSVR